MAGVFVVSSLVLGLRLGHSGSDNHISFACHRQDRRGGGESTSGGYLGPVSTVAGGERRGVAGALRSDQDMLLILTDSIAAKATTINLARGAPPRSSSIECDIKAALQRREAQASSGSEHIFVSAATNWPTNTPSSSHTEGPSQETNERRRKVASGGSPKKQEQWREKWRATDWEDAISRDDGPSRPIRGSARERDLNESGCTRLARRRTAAAIAEPRCNQATILYGTASTISQNADATGW